jgi:hypothetical protein
LCRPFRTCLVCLQHQWRCRDRLSPWGKMWLGWELLEKAGALQYRWFCLYLEMGKGWALCWRM